MSLFRQIDLKNLQDDCLEFFTSGDITWLDKYSGRINTTTIPAPLDFDTGMDMQGIVSNLFLYLCGWMEEIKKTTFMPNNMQVVVSKYDFLSKFYIEMKMRFGEHSARMRAYEVQSIVKVLSV